MKMSIVINFDTMRVLKRHDEQESEDSYDGSDHEIDLGPMPGGIYSLTEIPPNPDFIPSLYDMENARIKDVFVLSQQSLRKMRITSFPADYHPYAVTFTFNGDYVKYIRIPNQWRVFCKLFEQWSKSFIRRMKALHNDREIQCYELYPERTKNGTLHVHGLIYYNSSYYSGVSKIMSKAWVDLTKKRYGTSLNAQRRKNQKGGYDNAFDKCNNVKAWREYITKEYTGCAASPEHCLVFQNDTCQTEQNMDISINNED